jgi:signal transduction histidine kinase
LTVFGSGPTSFDGGEVKLLAQLSHDLSYGVVALRTRAARERLEQQLLEISERERRRIGQDLHDGLGQLIAAARLHCEATAHRLAMERLPAARDVTQVVRLLADAVDQTRRIARGLHPVHAGDEGLMAALGELADSVTAMSRVSCRFLCRQRVPVRDHGVATHLYRIAQEAVNNAVRHGRPRHIRIGLSSANGGVCLRIEDDGRGLPAPAKAGGGLGLSIMKYRASVIGATMAIGPRRGGGTVVTCEWRPGEKVTGSP